VLFLQVRALPAEVQDRGSVLQSGVSLPPLPQRGHGELMLLSIFLEVIVVVLLYVLLVMVLSVLRQT
jgi:hypothetical protein